LVETKEHIGQEGMFLLCVNSLIREYRYQLRNGMNIVPEYILSLLDQMAAQ
jgi:hypothetical protein